MSAVRDIHIFRLWRSYRPTVICKSATRPATPHKNHNITYLRARTRVPRNAFSGLLCCVVEVLFSVSNKNCKYEGIKTDTSVIDNSAIIPAMYYSKPYVPSTRFERATLGANRVPNKFYIFLSLHRTFCSLFNYTHQHMHI